MKKRVTHIVLGVVLIALDQISKAIAADKLVYHQPVKIIEKFFYLTYTENSGAAWSILKGQYIFFIVVAIFAVVFLVAWYLKSDRLLSQTALILMIAGTLGNLLDRFHNAGKVRDFLDFYPFGYDFPVFNLADSWLCIGAFFLFVDLLIEERLWTKKQSQ